MRPNMSHVLDRKCHEQISLIRSFNGSLLDNETAVKDSLESSLSFCPYNVTALVQYQQCALHFNERIRSCWNDARLNLDKATLIAAKLIRWSLTDLEDLLHRFPDIRIIHYVRDPRAIIASRIPAKLLAVLARMNDYSFSDESRALCIRMREDLTVKRLLESKYPGAILTVRYEDFVLSPAKTIEQVFEFIGRLPPVGIRRWMWTSMHGKRDNGRYGTVRVNSSILVDSWKKKVTYGNGTIMNLHCGDVLENLEYKL